MEERLELVTSFAELRAGMLCVGKPCGYCRGTHRFMLLSLNECSSDGHCFRAAPAALCGSDEMHIGPTAVALGRIYRVVDPGLETTTTTTVANKKKLERQR